jgi:hypothetical protein
MACSELGSKRVFQERLNSGQEQTIERVSQFAQERTLAITGDQERRTSAQSSLKVCSLLHSRFSRDADQPAAPIR